MSVKFSRRDANKLMSDLPALTIRSKFRVKKTYL
jgi:hypothetical protein